ncbi:CPBP family intramembrane glutamic endopeptidase [Corynebacterium tapiri]|uniref:CPBP family intramembrane metalloprotease n=1 Tax=Corynebacterium tapiri TaxID=1448266 RepID=A0A5C4U2K9_9CORY|nr:CPBP family intramembrane glutamic endopeptidase [Corynebacterium tapiri]TNL95603.1 CPBP family intramembrane metalloprotease [Corynebacterium tapiri]
MRRLKAEILVVLAVTFGMSGVRSVLRLIDALTQPTALNEQEVTLNSSQSSLAWLDLSLQIVGAASLFAWGALSLFLLAGDHIHLPRPRGRDLLSGAGLAALIGIPGLAFYLGAVHFGLSKVVVPSDMSHPLIEAPVLILWSLANAFAEEIVVVFYLFSRLRSLGWGLPAVLISSAVLRGSYHLYQGISAGFGNIIMGLVFGYVFYRTGKIWPLIVGHALIDVVAFLGYALLGDALALPG